MINKDNTFMTIIILLLCPLVCFIVNSRYALFNHKSHQYIYIIKPLRHMAHKCNYIFLISYSEGYFHSLLSQKKAALEVHFI